MDAESINTAGVTSTDAPWHEAFPAPSTTQVDAIQAEELLTRLQAGQRSGSDFLLIDLRRNDHTVCRLVLCWILRLAMCVSTLYCSCSLLSQGTTISGSLNLPAQTVWYSLSTILALCEAAKINLVIWYCGMIIFMSTCIKVTCKLTLHSGSSRGRGSRAAAWFRDYLQEQGKTHIRSVILEGGFKGWMASGEDFVQKVVGRVS